MTREATMLKHIIAILAVALLIVVCMFYPFLPGNYDGLAITLSVMSQLFGMIGLLLVLLGLIWLSGGWRQDSTLTSSRKRFVYWCGIASTIDAHLSFGVCVLLLWAYIAFRLVVWLRQERQDDQSGFNPLPLYLVILPLVAASFKFTLVAPAVELSRSRAIQNSATLIADIENFYKARGHYPHSLQSLNEDYKPQVVGVERYHYETSGNGYNVYFKHIAVALDEKEIVMFNRLGEHEYTSHNADILQYTPEHLSRTRGYAAIRDTSYPNWKYFLFD
jgi:hypothetical protein